MTEPLYKIKILVFDSKTQKQIKLSYITNDYDITSGVVSFLDKDTGKRIMHPLCNTEFEVLQ